MWCWIVPDSEFNELLQFLVLYLPIWLVIFHNLIVMALVLRKAQSALITDSQDNSKRLGMIRRKVFLYSGVLFITWFGATLNRTTEILTGHFEPALFQLSCFTVPLGGLWNALIFAVPFIRTALPQAGRQERRIPMPRFLMRAATRHFSSDKPKGEQEFSNFTHGVNPRDSSMLSVNMNA